MSGGACAGGASGRPDAGPLRADADAAGLRQAEQEVLREPLQEPLRARLERVVALATRPDARSLHGELLDELRALVREAETLPRPVEPAPDAAAREVVERPARRLHGT